MARFVADAHVVSVRWLYVVSIEDVPEECIFTPLCGGKYDRFAWQSYDSKKHTVLFKDEFSIDSFDVDVWKTAVAGDRIVVDVKYRLPKTCSLRMPMIFISQIALEEQTNALGVHERLYVSVLCSALLGMDEPVYERVKPNAHEALT